MKNSHNIELEKYDIGSILCSENRDFLVRNDGDQVNVEKLKGKIVGLYFSASWCGPCQHFTPKLVEVYNELVQHSKFEIVFVSADQNNESFDAYFFEMPWVAIPFSDFKTREALNKMFKVNGIPHLVIIDENGKILTDEGVDVIGENGAEGYPFSTEHFEKLEEQEEEAKRNQSLKSLLVSKSRDFVIRANGDKVSIAELDGKTVGLYFFEVLDYEHFIFTQKLVQVYTSLREKGNNFEIVMIPLDENETSFGEVFEDMPWFSLPVKDKCCEKLARYFEFNSLPTLVVIGPNGKTIHPNIAQAIMEHGVKAYPFTPEKFHELEDLEKAKREAQTLESVLVLDDRDFVIGKNGVKIPVSDLVGKDILLYFSAHWCPPCRAFLPKLTRAYQEINATNNNSLELIFVSGDVDQSSFDEFFSTMPWLAIPFGDPRIEDMSRYFKVEGIPTVVAMGPTGKTVSTEARKLIMSHGAKAYPFTNERIEEIEAEYEKMAEKWPKKLSVEYHDHELVLTNRDFFKCDKCGEEGRVWSYYCVECDIDRHLECGLDDKGKESEGEEKANTEGWVCDGDKCKRLVSKL